MEGIPFRNATQLQKGSIATMQLSPTRPYRRKFILHWSAVMPYIIRDDQKPSSTHRPPSHQAALPQLPRHFSTRFNCLLGYNAQLPRYVVTSCNFLLGGENLILHDTSYILQPISNIRILHPTSRVGKWSNCFTVHSAYNFHKTL